MARWASRRCASAMVRNVRSRAGLRKCSAPLVTRELAHHGPPFSSRRPGNGPILPRQQRGNTSQGYAAMFSFGTLPRNLQILLAVALGREVLGGHAELLAEHQCHRFRTTIR